MSAWFVPVLVAVAYAALLFWIAHAGDRHPVSEFANRHRRIIYGLSLAVYCTSWTFFGAVGTAMGSGLRYLPIYLGPIIMFVFFARFLERVLKVGKAQHSTSIADFLSARYGKSAWVAALVTLIALFGALPYMALQLKSISQTLAALSPGITQYLRDGEIVMAVAGAMAAFAVLFGTGRLDLTQHNRGMVLAIAVEALIKLIAIAAVAAFAIALLLTESSPSGVGRVAAETFSWSQIDARFVTLTAISAMAIMCLPRQFHMLVVEAQENRLVGPMRWLFPAYLVLICAAVLPVVLAGATLMPENAQADMLMLSLPLAYGSDALAMLAFIGGFSASTGMIIVTSIALSGMVTNDLIVPVFFRDRLLQRGEKQVVGPVLILVRRLTVVALLLLAYLYVRAVGSGSTLAGLGEIAFAGVAQFAPGLLLGFTWRRANRVGMIAGLIGGFAGWLVLLAAPVFDPSIAPFVIGDDLLVSGTVLSLATNTALLVIFSLVGQTNLADRVQAIAYVDRRALLPDPDELSTEAHVADFRLLLEQFVGDVQAKEVLNGLRLETGRNYRDADRADAALRNASERVISAIIGSSSARALIQSTIEGDPVSLEHVVAMFDETSQRLQFGAGLLQIAIENIDQGISVVDKDQRLVAWNRRYVEMFDLPQELVEIGRPIADLLGFNMRALGFPEPTIESEVEKRLGFLRAGTRHSTERVLSDGRVLRVLGNAAPNGGYVTSYSDVTADRLAEQALEAKVLERTEQLVRSNTALEAATRSKTRFLAAASHDLVQPLNAARLFASALSEEIDQERPREQRLLGQIDRSIRTADRLLRALLDISRLDGGNVDIATTRFSLDLAFAEIVNEFEVQAQAKAIQLIVQPCGLWIETDRGLFVSVLQNLVTNAVRYTESGKVLVGGKRRGTEVEILVADQGPGIAPMDLGRIFDEFTQLGKGRESEGLGLGLAIVKRIAAMLGTRVDVRSELGRGSCFSFRLPVVEPAIVTEVRDEASRQAIAHDGASVLCIDNDGPSCEAMVALLRRWGLDAVGARHPDEVPADLEPALILLDYRLDDGLTGDIAWRTLGEKLGELPPVVLLTAEDTDETKSAAAAMGAQRMIKPASPAALRALINAVLRIDA
ncbi:PAS-domain containing protein [Altererythrobacter arenosus]|uniref:histidine kinase n=1 Tax=Altererythrobacter arenosus TaxID=3032592 RepID=A0ABY8FVG7_9SPHN|nr:PAS-domain containing protein [Altererythrobacter sp. CAU 1644]WFL78983.1 PAS-domain containing protein [Altererythrobacter sp. CAU 1644]